ncbi:helix-turn-helix domain-containing protein [Actinomadura opuntiae]|uniref:helix-turn-helix domain-containing protein n=1 Tax=Actinomadura sp. OS1-43 TaxID=604315 RepID=UPI00255A8CE3|nr:helix-turn-helix transcriptional regulator [Actinomadura sp. OS1-43]MDL4813129.1 helix-turn-helix transcriptional regulator [Actinomadura sp. OS1-43]
MTGDWPDGAAAGDHPAAVAQEVARRLVFWMTENGCSLKRLGKESGVNRQTIANLLKGDKWPDLRTLALLEHSTGVPLWPTLPADRPVTGRAADEVDLLLAEEQHLLRHLWTVRHRLLVLVHRRWAGPEPPPVEDFLNSVFKTRVSTAREPR